MNGASMLRPVFPEKFKLPADINPAEYYDQINANGLRILWEQAVPCPCAEHSETDSARFNCPICNSHGWEFLPGIETKAIVTSVSLKDAPLEVIGKWGFGLVFVTICPEQAPGYHDRFTLLDSAIVMQDLVEHKGMIDSLRRPIVNRPMRLNVDGQPQEATLSVLHARKANEDGSAGEELTLGQDFEVTEDGKIDWTKGIATGTAPAIGSRYSVRYFGQPAYQVIDHPNAIRDTIVRSKLVNQTQAPLPVRALCKLEWMGFGDE